MNTDKFYLDLLKDLSHNPTNKQDSALRLISDFIQKNNYNELFLLKGYAGTGKTTIIRTLVKNSWKVNKSIVLMAPTGRAAKVISNYSNKEAFTIHKKIYYPKSKNGGGVTFTLQKNKHQETIFIVDEASMIPNSNPDTKLFDNGSLLGDLIQYVYSGQQCKLMLIGDTAQLPPIKLDISPALDKTTLENYYDKELVSIELNEVVRQEKESGILFNASEIRNQLEEEFYESFYLQEENFSDVIRSIDGQELMDALEDCYSNSGNEETVFIVRSNKRAYLYNQNIRTRILNQEQELAVGDYLMVVKNNYFWLETNSDAGFIANGDIIEILELFSIKELYGFRFATVTIRMIDYPNIKPFETVLILDTLSSETPSLTYEDSNKLYQEVIEDYKHETSKYKKFVAVKKNIYFNALQVKFSYAITCHKSQGGQWNTVFVEQPYLPNGIDKDFLRWLYTSITRAKEKLYLVGFKDEFFKDTY
ncbi:MAG: AAA family ATPase [Flavobacteriaceae bacterium]|nr:AAA family ATPase [Flavobacteriaceae bacterium]